MARQDEAWLTGNKPHEVVSVLDFGAVGDGVADDTTALMAFEAGDADVLEEAPAKTARDLSEKGYNLILRRGPGL